MKTLSARSDSREIEAFITSMLDVNPGNLVQFNHPSSHHFMLPEGEGVTVPQLLEGVAQGPSAGRSSVVYAAFPFCIPTQPKDCGFCPFPKVDLGDAEAGATRGEAVRRYLDHLYREIDLTTPHLGLPLAVDSVYFGGGTPNLLHPHEAAEMVGRVLAAFPPSAGAEVTFEGIPYLFTQEEKMAALAEAGVNRVSIGAQQLKDHLIRLSGRSTQTRRTVEVAVELARKHGLDHSVDLIFGWPQQTMIDALDDVRTVIDWQVPHLTVYPLNQPKSIAFSAPPYVDQIATVHERVLTYRAIRDLLLGAGYDQITMSDFQRRDRSHFDYENFTHDPLRVDMRAVGYSGFSRCAGTAAQPGVTWIGPNDLNDYYAQVDADRMPLRAFFQFTAHDVELSWLLNQMQVMKVPLAAYQASFGKDLLEEYGDLWRALERMGWIEISDGALRIKDDGVFYTALVQRMLAFDRDQELRKNRTLIGYRSKERHLPAL